MKHYMIIPLLLLVAGCQQKNGPVTNAKDYNVYLGTEQPKTTSKYFELWNSKITADSTQLLSFANVASEYNRYFKNTGDINYLKKAEQVLTKAVEIANINKASYARGLARNYISQHRFKEALEMAQLAKTTSGGAMDTKALLFDVHMELGNYELAKKHLDSIKNPADFGYLIRVAKWNDHKGNLDATIRFMETAAKRAESSKNRRLKLWSYTNLADYYGHAGRIKESYQYYLNALKLDSQNAYAKKGIAWIVFSHEKNSAEALRILDAVTENHTTPDYYLLKAEIAGFNGDSKTKAANMDSYYKMVQNPQYGGMYNAHNVNFYLEYVEDYDKALELAKQEVENRSTPESYGLLAKTYLRMDRKEEALELVENKIVGKTFEPAILMSVAEIYKANHLNEKVNVLKEELRDAMYELGPQSLEEIKLL